MIAQVPANATAEELQKIKDDAVARTEAYQKLTEAEEARKAWEASQDISKQAATDQSAAAKSAKDLADMQKAQAEAEKAKSEAELAATKAKFGEIPDSGYTGTADVETGAGKAEAMLLGAVAVKEIANTFSVAIEKGRPTDLTKLLLFTSQTAPDFQALLAFDAQFDALEFAIEQAKESTKDVAAESGDLKLTVATVGLGLEAINKLLGFFKTDYKFHGIEMESTDAMLLSALAGQLRSKGIKVELPSLFHPAALANASAVLDRTTKLYDWGLQAKQRVRAYEQTQAAVERQLAAKPDDEALKKRLQKVEEAVSIWKALEGRIDGWAKQAAGADDKGNVPLAAIIRQAAIRKALDDGAGFAVVQLHKVAGTSYTKKNLWSSFGANPFYVMGGAVASLTAFTGKEGEVFASELMPWHGGYHSVSDVQTGVNQTAP